MISRLKQNAIPSEQLQRIVRKLYKKRQQSLPQTQKYMIAYFPALIQLLIKWWDKTNRIEHMLMFYITEKSQHGNNLAK